METITLLQYFSLFLIYSFLGWCTEVCFQAVVKGKIVNRGFMNGPMCPIYGFGMVGVLLLVRPIYDSPFLIFLLGLVICSLLELVGGWVLKKIFDTRWWDYSDRRFNLGGYICLEFSLMWGLAVLFVVRIVHPPILAVVDHLPELLLLILTIVCYALFAVDFVMTLITIIGIRSRIRELDRVAEALHTLGDNISDRLGNTALNADEKLEEAKEAGQERVAEAKAAGQERVAEAKAAGQERLAEAREASLERREAMARSRARLEEALRSYREGGREKLDARFADAADLLERHIDLEERQKEIRSRLQGFLFAHSTRRLSSAFPQLAESLRGRMSLRHEPEEEKEEKEA